MRTLFFGEGCLLGPHHFFQTQATTLGANAPQNATTTRRSEFLAEGLQIRATDCYTVKGMQACGINDVTISSRSSSET